MASESAFFELTIYTFLLLMVESLPRSADHHCSYKVPCTDSMVVSFQVPSAFRGPPWHAPKHRKTHSSPIGDPMPSIAAANACCRKDSPAGWANADVRFGIARSALNDRTGLRLGQHRYQHRGQHHGPAPDT
jgi:hypothetical protein